MARVVGTVATSSMATRPAVTSRALAMRRRRMASTSATRPIAARMSPGWLDTIHIRCGRRASSSGHVDW